MFFKKILSGSLNLEPISKPSRMSLSQSFLQCLIDEYFILSNYIEKAVNIEDPKERIKLIGTGFFANLHYNPAISNGLIPLVGLTGETLHGSNSSGTKIYTELIDNSKQQILIHMIGKNKEFQSIRKFNVY